MRLQKVLIIVFAAMFIMSCGDKSEKSLSRTQGVVSLKVKKIIKENYTASEEVLGTIQAGLSATIEAKVNGTIEKMFVAPGQLVSAGDALVQLDVKELQAKLDQAKALMEQASRDLKRIAAVVDQKAVSQQEYDAAAARSRVAEATVSEVETMLSYSKVIAPYNGIITKKSADVGDLSVPGKPILQMEDPSALRIEIDVPEGLIDFIKLGQNLSVAVSGQSDLINAKISEITPRANPNSRTFLIKADIVQASGIRTGQFCRVYIPVATRSIVKIPKSSVIQRGQMEFVYVAKDQKAVLRIVKSGKLIGDDVEIISGLSEGEEIIIDNLSIIEDGRVIKVEQ